MNMLKLTRKLILLCFLSILIFTNSCKKGDLNTDKFTNELKVKQFLNVPESLTDVIKQIAKKIEADNNKTHYLESIVDKLGMPNWEKAIISPRNAMYRTESEEGYDLQIIIPINQPNEQTITGFFACIVQSNNIVDIAKLIEADKYSQFYFSNNQIILDKEDLALMCIYIEAETFGNEYYRIFDKSLFNYDPSKVNSYKLVQIYNKGNTKDMKLAYFDSNTKEQFINNTEVPVLGVCLDPNPGNGEDDFDHQSWNFWHYIQHLQNSLYFNGGFNNGGEGGGGGWGYVPSVYSLTNRTNADTNDDDIDNNTTGGYDLTQYQQYDPSQTWPSINSVIPPSNFVGWGAPGISKNCMDYAKAQIAKKGYKISNYYVSGQTIQIYTESGGVNQNSVKDGIGYLISALQRGIPVIVGVDDQSGSSNPATDNTTDHFVVIVGMGTDATGKYFTFYDNASGDVTLGASPNNKLYYNPTTGKITGQSQTPYAISSPRNYTITMMRKSK